MATTYHRIDAVQKAGQILKYMSAQKGACTGPEIAQALKFTNSTVMSHLSTLSDLGFVQQVGDGWQLGMGLALIWARVKSNLDGQRDRINRDIESISIPGGN